MALKHGPFIMSAVHVCDNWSCTSQESLLIGLLLASLYQHKLMNIFGWRCCGLTEQDLSWFLFQCFFSFFVLAVDLRLACAFKRGLRARRFCSRRYKRHTHQCVEAH